MSGVVSGLAVDAVRLGHVLGTTFMLSPISGVALEELRRRHGLVEARLDVELDLAVERAPPWPSPCRSQRRALVRSKS